MSTIIGITGGIGSGKSTISKIITHMGYKVYNCDVSAKKLMSDNLNVVKFIIDIFGEDSYSGGGLNRSYISEKVFNNRELLDKLENIVHPAVDNDFGMWCEQHSADDLIFVESAILIESGFIEKVDYAINISAPEDLRIRRVVRRDKLSYSQIEGRIANQISDCERDEKCDYTIICNDETLLIPQINCIIEKIQVNEN